MCASPCLSLALNVNIVCPREQPPIGAAICDVRPYVSALHPIEFRLGRVSFGPHPRTQSPLPLAKSWHGRQSSPQPVIGRREGG